jgi:hypothetical protein
MPLEFLSLLTADVALQLALAGLPQAQHRH